MYVCHAVLYHFSAFEQVAEYCHCTGLLATSLSTIAFQAQVQVMEPQCRLNE